jgi:hypothetical protein
MQKLNVRFTNDTKTVISATGGVSGFSDSEIARAAINIGLAHINTHTGIESNSKDFEDWIKNNQTV